MKKKIFAVSLAVCCLLAACGKPKAGAGEESRTGAGTAQVSREEAQDGKKPEGAPQEQQGAAGVQPENEEEESAQGDGGWSAAEAGRIEEQTFSLNLVPYGEVTFTAIEPDAGQNPTGDVTFAVIKDGQRVYTFPGVFEDNVRSNEMFSGVEAVSFPDLNKDGYDDVIIICQYAMASGPDSGKIYPEVRIYQGSGSGAFTLLTREMEEVNSALKEPTVWSVREFLEKGDAPKAEEWRDAYIDLLEDNKDEEGWEGYDLIYLDDDEIPELVMIGAYEAAGCRIVAYFDGGLQEAQLDRLNFTYIPGQGLLCNSDGLMDHYYDLVYRMREGKLALIGEGRYGMNDDAQREFDEEGNPVYQYFWNGAEMSEAEYGMALQELYDQSAAAACAWPGMSAEEMIETLSKGMETE